MRWIRAGHDSLGCPYIGAFRQEIEKFVIDL
jgi:hypothetical protein